MGATVGTVWVGVAPSAVGFQRALEGQIRGQMRGGGVNQIMAQSGASASQAYNKGFTSTKPPKSFLHGPSVRSQRATRRNMTRAGRRSGQSFAQGMGQSMKSTGRSLTFTASGAAALALGATALVSAKYESALSAALAVAEPEALAGKAGEKAAESYARRFGTKLAGDFRAVSQKVGKETIFSNLEAAQGLEILSRGGLNAKQSIEALMPTANLAAAGQLDLAEAANISVSALNQFKDTEITATEAGNQLAVAANKSQATVQSLGLSMQYAGAAAAASNQSYAGTLTAMTLLGKTGIVGSKAGTRTLNFFDGLRGKSAKAKTEIKDLGLKFYQSNGEMKDFVGISKELKRVFKDMPEKDRADALFDIFGKRGSPLALEAIKTSLKDIKTLYGEVEGASDDALEKLALAQLGPVAHAFELMKGEWETALSAIGKAFEGDTTKVINWLEGLAMKINEMDSEELRDFGKTFAKRLAIIAAVGPGFWLGGAALGAAKKLANAFKFLGNQAAIAWAKMQLFATPAPLRGLMGRTGGATNLLPGVTSRPGHFGQSVIPPIVPGLTRKEKRDIKRKLKERARYAQGLAGSTMQRQLKTGGAGKGGATFFGPLFPKKATIAKMFAPLKKIGGKAFAPLRVGSSIVGRLGGKMKSLTSTVFKSWQGWVGAGSRIVRFGKLAATATGVGALLAAAVEGVFEAVSRSGEQEGGGFVGNLKKSWENLKSIGDQAKESFNGVGESLSELAQVSGLDALWGAVQSGLASVVEAGGWLLEFLTGGIPNAVQTAADAIFTLSTGIQRAFILARKAAAWFSGDDEAMEAAEQAERDLDASQDARKIAAAQRDRAKADRELASAKGELVDQILAEGKAEGKTKSALQKAGVLDVAVQTGKFTLVGRPRQQAQLALGKEFAGKPLKATIPIALRVGGEGGKPIIANVEQFGPGSTAEGLQELILGKGESKKVVRVQVITQSNYDNLGDAEKNYFREVTFSDGKTRLVRVRMETELDPEGEQLFNAEGKPLEGRYILKPEVGEVPEGGLPVVKLEGEVTGVTNTSTDPVTVPVKPTLAPGVAGGVGLGPLFAAFGPVEVPIKPIILPDWLTAGDLGAKIERGLIGNPISVPMKAGPELAQSVKLVMGEATTQINELTADKTATVTVKTPGLEKARGSLRAIKNLAAKPQTLNLAVKVTKSGLAGAISGLESVAAALGAVKAKSPVTAKVTPKTGGAMRKLKAVLERMVVVDAATASPTVSSPTAGVVVAQLATISSLLSTIDGTHASASVSVSVSTSGSEAALSAAGFGAVSLPAGGGGGEGVGASEGGMAARGGGGGASSLTGGVTRGNPIKGGLSGFGKTVRGYKNILKQIKKAMKKLRGGGVKEINKTTKALNKSIREFEKAGKGKKGAAKKAYDKQAKALNKSNDKLKKAATKRKDVLKQISEDTKQYLAASTRSFKFASRGTSEQIKEAQKELRDTFTLAGVPKNQQRKLKRVTKGDRGELRALARQLEVIEKAAEFKDRLTETIEGSVDWGKFVNAGDLTRHLNRVTANMAEYQKNLITLRGRGVSKEVVEQLAQGDPERAALLAKNLAQATDGEIAGLNKAFSEFTKQAGATGDTAAGAAFAEIGKGAMTGFAKGMVAEEKRIRKRVQVVVNRIVKNVKKAMGIKSPSTVFAEIGRDMMRGVVVGVVSESLAVRRAVLNGASPNGLPASARGVTPGNRAAAGGGVNIDVYPAAGMNEAELAKLVGREFLWAAG